MKTKRTIAMLLAAALLATAFVGDAGQKAPFAAEAAAVEEEDYTTGDASLDNPRNQDGIGENELLVISFGTSFNDNRRLTIGAIEEAMEKAFPEYSVRRGFTSQIIIDHVKRRDGETIDNVGEALDRAVANGVKNLVIQPTHLMDGFEYNDVVNEVAQYADAFESLSVGAPILTSEEDFQTVAKALADATASYDDGKTAICFMGHGTEAESNKVYARMQQVLTDGGYTNCFVGTVEAAPTVEDVLALVRSGSYERVVLRPMMIVAGDHANNDMASDEEDSWKSLFENAGYEVVCDVHGLGELEVIQNLLVEHAKAAAGTTQAPEETEKSQVASAKDMGTVENVVEEGMAPVSGSSIKDGTYPVTVDSSSSMFKIIQCELTVENGEMTAVMHMGGTGYLKVFMGTGEEAVKAEEASCIPVAQTEGGIHTFTVPVEALNKGIPCAAFSKKKGMWYDRTLVFRADSLPLEAFRDGALVTAESLGLADGNYTVDVQLAGGSGKTTVESPAALRLENGAAYATVVLSSSKYDYMKVNGEKLLPLNAEGNAAFEIPVAAFDRKLPILADTTAMSTPHEIEYTLYFDSTTIQAVQ